MILQRRRDISSGSSERLTDSTPLSCFVWGHDILASFCTRMLSVFYFINVGTCLVAAIAQAQLNPSSFIQRVCGCVSNVWCCRVAALTLFCFDSLNIRNIFFSPSARIIFFYATADFFALRIIEFNWKCVLKKMQCCRRRRLLKFTTWLFIFHCMLTPPSSHRVELQLFFSQERMYWWKQIFN